MLISSRIKWDRVGQSGFTLIEIMVTVAIAAVLATMAIPNYLEWQANQNLKDDTASLKGDLQIARIMALKMGSPTAVQLNVPEPGRYLVFLDNGAGQNRNNGARDDDEDLLDISGHQISAITVDQDVKKANSRALAPGLSFDAAVQAIGFAASGYRSFPAGGAPVVLTLNQKVHGTSTPRTKSIEVMATGGVRVQKIQPQNKEY